MAKLLQDSPVEVSWLNDVCIRTSWNVQIYFPLPELRHEADRRFGRTAGRWSVTTTNGLFSLIRCCWPEFGPSA